MKNTITRISLLFTVFLSIGSYGQSIKPHTIGIVVSDIQRATKWYENVLRMELYKEMTFPEYDDLKIYFLQGEHFQLELMEKNSSFSISEYVRDYSINKEPLIGYSKIVFSVQDIATEYERLSKLDVTEVLGITEDKEFNSVYFIIKDPDGNVIQFIKEKAK